MDDLNNQSIGWLDVPAACAAPVVVDTVVVVNSTNNASRLPARTVVVVVVERFSIPARHRVARAPRRDGAFRSARCVVVNRVNMSCVRARRVSV
jgi:hypothetical protein